MADERAINLALRVLGIGEIERDFKRVGDAGAKSFAEVRKGTNGAALEVSEYTARLKAAVAEAKRLAGQIPDLNKPTAESRTNRLDFIKGAVQSEKDRMVGGLPGLTSDLGAADDAAAGLGSSITRMAAFGAAAGAGLALLAQGVKASLEAFQEHEAALAKFEATLALTGNRSRASGEEIKALAAAVSQATGETEAETLKAGQVLAQVSGLTRDALKQAMEASAAYARAIGVDLPEVITGTTAPVLQALAKNDLPALWKATEDLNDPLRVVIQSLAEAGRTADAQVALFNGLGEAAGDGPGGLTDATDKLANSWTRLKTSLGESIAEPAVGQINWLAGTLDWLDTKIEGTRVNWARLLQLGTSVLAGGFSGLSDAGRGGSFFLGEQTKRTRGFRARGQQQGNDVAEQKAAAAGVKRFEAMYGGGSKPRSGGGGGGRKRSGGAGANTAEKLQREAEAARAAADRTAEANADVAASFEARSDILLATIGLEGDALKEIERAHAVEAAQRRLNIDWIEQEVEARRKAAAAAKQPFDDKAVLAAVTAEFRNQTVAVGAAAGALYDAEAAMAAWNRRSGEARAILEGLKTPFDAIADQVGQATTALKGGLITIDQFDSRMGQLAKNLAEARFELDEGAQAWSGYGREMASSLAEMIRGGAGAIDILQELLGITLDRLWEQNFVNPLGDLIDGLTGNNQAKNTAAARASLPQGADIGTSAVQVLAGPGDGAALALGQVGVQGQAAALALGAVAAAAPGQALLGDQTAVLSAQVGTAAASFGELIPLTGQFSGALGQLIASMSGAGGGSGAGGLLGTLLKIGGAALGGGITASGSAALAGDVSATFAANPMLFASGTDSVPIGRPFFVGESGREKMLYHGGGRMEVISGPRTHREEQRGGGGVIIQQTVNVPQSADPRRTATTVARGTQQGLARAARRNLAAPARRP